MKAVIFDKDGTLMAFDPFWAVVADKALSSLAARFGILGYTCEMKRAVGLRNGKTETDSVLCAGTYSDIATVINGALKSCGVSVSTTGKEVAEVFTEHMRDGRVQPVCEDLPKLMTRFRKRGNLLFLVTTDNAAITRRCLKILGISDQFEKIYTDDGTMANKPDPSVIYEIERVYDLRSKDLCMVGDTVTDMRFAKNGGITAICVGESPAAQSMADFRIKNISYLDEFIK